MTAVNVRPRRRALVLGVVTGVLAGAIGAYLVFAKGCAEKPRAPESRPAGAYSKAAPIPDAVEPPPLLSYVDVTRAAGVAFVHESGARGKKLLPETMGAGCGWFDYDGDGDPDLLLLNGTYWDDDPRKSAPSSRLYRNDGDWKFTDVTVQAGLAAPFYAMGCSAADTDGDGDRDLFISGVGGYRFFRNDAGTFVDATVEAALIPGTWKDEKGREHGCFASSAAFLDYDDDQRPDLFVCHYVRWSAETDVWSTMDGKTKSYAIPTQYQGESCRLWRNLGGNRFEDATDKARVRNDEGKSLGVCVLDLEDDGWPEIAVANDTQPNYLYRNNKDGTFTDIGLDCGIAYGPDGRARAGMGVDSGCISDSGCLALAVGNFSGEPVSLFEQLPNKSDIMINKSDQWGVAVVTQPMLKFGVLLVDADQDGRNDLVIANGHIEPTVQAVHKETPYQQPMQLLRNIAGRRFSDVSKGLGADFTRPRVGRSLAAADVDGDGDLDFCVTSNGGAPALLRCDMPAARGFRVRLKGVAPGTDALGARVSVHVGGREAVQRVRTGGSYLALSDTTLTFGLGDHAAPEKLEVTWPGGRQVAYEPPFPAGAVCVIDASSGIVR